MRSLFMFVAFFPLFCTVLADVVVITVEDGNQNTFQVEVPLQDHLTLPSKDKQESEEFITRVDYTDFKAQLDFKINKLYGYDGARIEAANKRVQISATKGSTVYYSVKLAKYFKIITPVTKPTVTVKEYTRLGTDPAEVDADVVQWENVKTSTKITLGQVSYSIEDDAAPYEIADYLSVTSYASLKPELEIEYLDTNVYIACFTKVLTSE